jgi:hypothetical protein
MKFKLKIGKNKIVILSIVFFIFVSGFGIYIKVLSPGPELNTETKSAVEDLLSLPYLSYVENDPNPEKKGVTFYNENLSYPGVNLFITGKNQGAYLIDMDGEIIHSWSGINETIGNWKYSEMDENGNLIVLDKKIGLIKMDFNSNIIWTNYASDERANQEYYHHDFELSEKGDIYVLAKSTKKIKLPDREILSKVDNLLVIDSNGVLKEIIPLSSLILDGFPKTLELLEKKAQADPKNLLMSFFHAITIDEIGGFFHANTIEEIHQNIGIANKGDLLFCDRNLNLIGIIDRNNKELIWSWGPGILDHPHQPTVLENGNLLIFDNGMFRNYSRILELNPRTEKIVWKYEADPKGSFYTSIRGGNQRLPNGNTLITESNKGHVFEVNNDGEIVWEFWNPDFDKKVDEK